MSEYVKNCSFLRRIVHNYGDFDDGLVFMVIFNPFDLRIYAFFKSTIQSTTQKYFESLLTLIIS